MSATGETQADGAATDGAATGGGLETHAFGAEVGRLLDLVVHALYSDREIFLRELVANAADAMDRRRFEALTEGGSALPPDAKVRVSPDKEARTLTVSDAGVGMAKEDLAQNLGTIARSGPRAFSQTLDKAEASDRPSLIGQFGVGFYSAFMVADQVRVTSRRVGSEEAWAWASDGQGGYTLESAERAEPGTDIVLHLKADADEYLEPYRLDHLVRKWADFITVPVAVVRDGKEEAANQGTALWRKAKSEIDPAQYEAFYHALGMNFDKPWATLHWRAEGQLEFSALLFVPGARPFQAVEGERESRVRLHVRRMFITDEAGLLPSWLRFVQGVVDTEDLPLNVSREMLQSTPALARIRRAVTGRVLSELASRAKASDKAASKASETVAEGADTVVVEAADAPPSYDAFWENFGPVLKEGIYEDHERRSEIAPLLRFRSSAVEGWTSLPAYVARMKDGQEAIHYLVADDAEALKASPQLEGFRARGLEVLLLSDHVDAFWPDALGRFDEKPLRSVTQGGLDLSKFAPDGEREDTEAPENVDALVAAVKLALGGEVSDVRATDRLVDSAVVLSAGANGPDLQMQRLLRRAGRATSGQPVLEINPRHPLIRGLVGAPEGEVARAAGTLLDLARIQDGDTPRDAAAFVRTVTEALASRPA